MVHVCDLDHGILQLDVLSLMLFPNSKVPEMTAAQPTQLRDHPERPWELARARIQ
jgi:hypothetical protein